MTLSLKDGGIPVSHALQCLYEESWPRTRESTAPIQYLLWDGDVTKPEDTWTLSSSTSLSLSSVSHADGAVGNAPPKAERKWNREDAQSGAVSIGDATKDVTTAFADVFSSLFGSHRFSFIHAGAVQDFGQRREHYTSQLPSSSGASPHEKGSSAAGNGGVLVPKKEEVEMNHSKNHLESANAENHHLSSSHTSALLPDSTLPLSPDSETTEIVPWFMLLRPQLRLALQYIAPGGSIVLVYGVPHCASFFIFLHALRLCLGKGLHIRLFETMHLSKAPVYVLLENVHVTPPEGPIGEEEEEEERHRRQVALLHAMDPASPVVCPYFLSGASGTTNDLGSSLTSTECTVLRAKQHFWLGESEEGMAAAVAGYTFFHREIERIWDRARGYLERRRQRAESALQTAK